MPKLILVYPESARVGKWCASVSSFEGLRVFRSTLTFIGQSGARRRSVYLCTETISGETHRDLS